MLWLFKVEPTILSLAYLRLHMYICILSNYKVLLDYFAFKNIEKKAYASTHTKNIFCEVAKKTENICIGTCIT